MLRRLLTLVAIVTGLTALGAPVHARSVEVAGVELAAPGIGSSQLAKVRAASSGIRDELAISLNSEAPMCPRPTVTIMIPTVELGADRARE